MRSVIPTHRALLGLLPLVVAPFACSSSNDAPAPAGSVVDASTEGGSSGAVEAGDAGASFDGAALSGRPYKSFVPSKYDPSRPAPLVVLLHGYTASGDVQESYFKLAKVAEDKTFLYAYPDGTVDARGNRFWNAASSCCNFFGAKVDDVAYVTAVIDEMSAKHSVDPKRIYLVGHSNGGFMAHRMACELSGRIAAIVSLAGTLDQDTSACKPAAPVSVLQVHGDADGTIAYTGGSVASGVPSFLGAREAVAFWAKADGCDPTLAAGGPDLDLDTGLAAADTNVLRHACARGAAELWTIRGGAHTPAFQADWAARVWGFLEAHPKP